MLGDGKITICEAQSEILDLNYIQKREREREKG